MMRLEDGRPAKPRLGVRVMVITEPLLLTSGLVPAVNCTLSSLARKP